MARVCTICSSPHRAEIDEALTRGEPNRRIAARCGVSETSLRRHAAEHLPRALVLAKSAEEETRADDLLGLLKEALADARRLRGLAEKDGDFRCAVAAVKAFADVAETLVRVAEKLAEVEKTKPPILKPALSDDELAGAVEALLARAAAREGDTNVH